MTFKRLFKLSKPEYYADFVITPSITLMLFVLTVRSGAFVVWMFCAGMLAWSWYEYAIHRWLLHSAWAFKTFHGMHHDDQRDYIAIHPAITLAIYTAWWFAFGVRSNSVMLGTAVGYIIYSVLHTAFHFAAIRNGSPLFNLKRRHAIHHRFETTNYGVITSLWDRVFGTEARSEYL